MTCVVSGTCRNIYLADEFEAEVSFICRRQLTDAFLKWPTAKSPKLCCENTNKKSKENNKNTGKKKEYVPTPKIKTMKLSRAVPNPFHTPRALGYRAEGTVRQSRRSCKRGIE